MKKQLLLVLAAVCVIIACKKDKEEEIVNNVPSQSFKVDVDGVSRSFEISYYTYQDLFGQKSISITGSTFSEESISVAGHVAAKGDLGETLTQTIAHVSHPDSMPADTFSGSLNITKWDTARRVVSGNFNFIVVENGDTTEYTNGVFTEVPALF